MNLSIECLEAAQVASLLHGNLTPEEYATAQEHLELCEHCRSGVEEAIGPEQWWGDVQSVLRDSPSAFLAEGSGSAGEAKSNDTPTAQLLDLLGPTDDPNMLGRIGSYEIIGLLGQGGMGAVFKGFDRSLNRFVAIKMLLPHLAASGAARKRFAREGQAVAAVVDDHVMAIHCVDEWQGIPYLVMTYSRGVSLQKRLSDKGPLEVRKILRIGMQAAKGLAAAHAQGIVHRDIKPANIFLDQNVERVQLMDFGLARAVDDASLTRSGTLAGTPQYMSPEQARAETVDHRSDLFSLGSVLYAMSTGHAPFRAESSYSVLRLITDKEPRAIRENNPNIPEWLCAIISKLMSKQTCDRFESAAQVAELLEDCLAHLQSPTTSELPAENANRRPKRSVSISQLLIGVFVMCCSLLLAILLVLQVIEPTAKTGPSIVDKSSPSTGHFIRRTAVDIQIRIQGVAAVDQQLVFEIEESKHNKALTWKSGLKEGPFTVIVTRTSVPTGPKTSLPGFTYQIVHDENGGGGKVNIACSENDPLPNATIHFEIVKPEDRDLRGDRPMNRLRIAKMKYPDGTEAAVTLSLQAGSDDAKENAIETSDVQTGEVGKKIVVRESIQMPGSRQFPTETVKQLIAQIEDNQDVVTAITKLQRITGLDFGTGVESQSRSDWLNWWICERDCIDCAAGRKRPFIIVGTVKDEAGNAVPGGSVLVDIPSEESATGQYTLAQTIADHNGRYVLAFGLPLFITSEIESIPVAISVMEPAQDQTPENNQPITLQLPVSVSLPDETAKTQDDWLRPSTPRSINFVLPGTRHRAR